MRRSKIVVYLHLVWATKGRQPLILPEMEREIHRCIASEAEKCGCAVVAIGGMPDHIHVLVKYPATISIAELVKRMKGISSALANDLHKHSELFRWQEGYAVFSVNRSHQKAVCDYVRNQKQHHAEGSIHADWEETDQEYHPEQD